VIAAQPCFVGIDLFVRRCIEGVQLIRAVRLSRIRRN
jgi:hypothetical protein